MLRQLSYAIKYLSLVLYGIRIGGFHARKESVIGGRPYAIQPGYISYKVYVEAPDFAKMRLVKQHQLVTRALSSQIKDMHGIRISTAVSS